MMHTESFFSLYNLDYDLHSVYSLRQRWSHRSSFEMSVPRKTGCLLYLWGCSARYREKGRTVSAPKGSVVYIPEGACYKVQYGEFEDLPDDTVLLEFRLVFPDGTPFSAAEGITVLQKERDLLLEELFRQAAEEQNAPLKATAYQILNHLSRAQRQNLMLPGRFRSIAQGIRCLEEDFLQEKTLQQIAQMCFVSESHFRRLFKEYAGVSPAEYRIACRMEYAKKLLRSGTVTVREAAAKTGFKDPAYFGRVFKKSCGISPGEYMKQTVYENHLQDLHF